MVECDVYAIHIRKVSRDIAIGNRYFAVLHVFRVNEEYVVDHIQVFQ